MALPIRSKNPPESFPRGTVALLLLNVIAFAFTVDENLRVRPEIAFNLGLSYGHFNGLALLLYPFLHSNLLHLAANMWFLYLFGFAVEGRLRTPRFIALYFGASVAGGLLYLAVFGSRFTSVPLIGASGAIMGVLGAALYLFPYSKVQFALGLFGWRAATWDMVWVAAYYAIVDLIFALTSGGTDGIAHTAHIGGAIAGLAICVLMRPVRDSRETSDAKAALVDTKDLSLLSSAELESMAAVDTGNTGLVLSWLHRNIRDGRISEECRAAFVRLLPEILERESAPKVALALLALCNFTNDVRNEHLVYVAFRLEGMDEAYLALRIYNVVLERPGSPEPDIEAAMFRSAMLYERLLQEPKKAAAAYRELIHRFPMSPMAEQAKLRLTYLNAS